LRLQIGYFLLFGAREENAVKGYSSKRIFDDFINFVSNSSGTIYDDFIRKKGMGIL